MGDKKEWPHLSLVPEDTTGWEWNAWTNQVWERQKAIAEALDPTKSKILSKLSVLIWDRTIKDLTLESHHIHVIFEDNSELVVVWIFEQNWDIISINGRSPVIDFEAFEKHISENLTSPSSITSFYPKLCLEHINCSRISYASSEREWEACFHQNNNN